MFFAGDCGGEATIHHQDTMTTTVVLQQRVLPIVVVRVVGRPAVESNEFVKRSI